MNSYNYPNNQEANLPQCIEMTPVQQPPTPINNQIPQNYPFPQQPFQPVQSYIIHKTM